jgi:hypothetical protein
MFRELAFSLWNDMKVMCRKHFGNISNPNYQVLLTITGCPVKEVPPSGSFRLTSIICKGD